MLKHSYNSTFFSVFNAPTMQTAQSHMKYMTAFAPHENGGLWLQMATARTVHHHLSWLVLPLC
jgi:hypothetical protein